MSTAPYKYRIVDPEGSIKPHCCVDIVIRHLSIMPSFYHVTDKFRIQMNEHNSRQLLGKKDLSVTLLPGKSSGISSSPAASQDNFKQFTTDMASASSNDSGASMHVQTSSDLPKLGNQFLAQFTSNLLTIWNYYITGYQTGSAPNYIAIAVAIVCIIALMLPSNETEGSSSSMWSLFHLSSQQKLVFAYSLGKKIYFKNWTFIDTRLQFRSGNNGHFSSMKVNEMKPFSHETLEYGTLYS